MGKQENISAWLDDAPQQVRDETSRLLAAVDSMRDSEQIFPPQDDILNALAYTAPEDVRVVILGQDPYHDDGQAMGLSFSVPAGMKLPPSLRNIYKEMSADLNCMMPTSGDLTSWAEQGVLLLNTTLTVKAHNAYSHSKLGWQTLTDYVIKRCMELPQPVVFMGWGKPALKMIEGAQSKSNNKFVLASTHPSPLSANRAGKDLQAFMGSRPFSKANGLLILNGSEPIQWERAGE